MISREKAVARLNVYYDLLETAQAANSPERRAEAQGAAYFALAELTIAMGSSLSQEVLERYRHGANPGELPTVALENTEAAQNYGDRQALQRLLYDFGLLLPTDRDFWQRAFTDLVLMDQGGQPLFLTSSGGKGKRPFAVYQRAARNRLVLATVFKAARDSLAIAEVAPLMLKLSPTDIKMSAYYSWRADVPETALKMAERCGRLSGQGETLSPEDRAFASLCEVALEQRDSFLRMAKGEKPKRVHF